MKRRSQRGQESAGAPSAKRARTNGERRGPPEVDSEPQFKFSDITSDVQWTLIYPRLGVCDLLHFCATSKEYYAILDNAHFMANFFETHLLFGTAVTLRELSKKPDSKTNRKEIKKVIKEGFEHLATFSLHLLDDSDVVVIFETTTRKDITYMTEETELALVEERNEKLRQREEVIEKKLNEMRRGLRGKRKTLALEKLEELTPWPPPLPPLHPSLIVKRLKEEMVRIAWKEVSFLTIDLTEDEIRWKDLTEADDLSEAQQLELSNIPPEEEWPSNVAKRDFLVPKISEKINEWKTLAFRFIIDNDGVYAKCWALRGCGPRNMENLLVQGFSQRGLIRWKLEFTRSSPAHFTQEWRNQMLLHTRQSGGNLINLFDDFRDEGRLRKALRQSPTLLFDERIRRGMSKAEVVEVFGPISRLRHYNDIQTYKTLARHGNFVGNCFFIFENHAPDVLAGLRWQFTVPTEFASNEVFEQIVKYVKQSVNLCKKEYGKEMETFGKLTKPRVVSAVEHQHDILPLRQLGLGFLLGLMGLPTLNDKDDIFGMRFQTGAMANLYAMYIPVGEGHVELAYSLVPLPNSV